MSYSGMIKGTIFSYPLQIIVEDSILKFRYRNSGNLEVPYEWDGDDIMEYDQTNPSYEKFLSDWKFKNWPNHLLTFEDSSQSLRLRIGWNEYVLKQDTISSSPPNLRHPPSPLPSSDIENQSNEGKCDCFPSKKFCSKNKKLAYLELIQGGDCQLLISYRKAYTLPWTGTTIRIPFRYASNGVAIRFDINPELSELHQLLTEDPILDYSHCALVTRDRIELTMYGGTGRFLLTFESC